MNWDDPAARAGLIERIGSARYSHLYAEHRRRLVVATVAGHDIRPVMTRFGRLYSVGDTGRAFRTRGEADAHATANPKEVR